MELETYSSVHFDEHLVEAALGALNKNEREDWNAARKTIAQVLDSRTMEWALTAVIILNVVAMVRDTDILAYSDPEDLPIWSAAAGKSFTVVY